MAEAHAAPNAELLEWPKKDKRGFVHVVYPVGDLDHTIKFCTECLGMKLLKKRDIPEEKYSNAFLGFESEETNFVVELIYNYGVYSYDIGTGFGHFAIATPYNYILVEDISAKGGVVVRCALMEQGETDDWRRNAIFETYTMCGDKTYKVIIDSGSSINAVSPNAVSSLGLELIPHPNPYNVSWVDDSSIAIKKRCIVPIQFQNYKAQIWCDVIPMNVGHIILGRPWLFDLDVTLHGRSNSCSFEFEGEKIVLNPLKPKAENLNIISPEYKYTLAMLGYVEEHETTVLELNYGVTEYTMGNASLQVLVDNEDFLKELHKE